MCRLSFKIIYRLHTALVTLFSSIKDTSIIQFLTSKGDPRAVCTLEPAVLGKHSHLGPYGPRQDLTPHMRA